MMSNALGIYIEQELALPDTDRYRVRHKVKSESSDKYYLISFDMSACCWTCSCPGNIRHGQCKHLSASGLKGRKFGKDTVTLKKLNDG